MYSSELPWQAASTQDSAVGTVRTKEHRNLRARFLALICVGQEHQMNRCLELSLAVSSHPSNNIHHDKT